MKKVLCLVLVALMLVAVLAACGEKEKDPDPVNLSTCSMADLVAYLTAKGYIAEGTKPVDINTTAGYHKDNTKNDENPDGAFPVVVWADDAKDYGGIWLFWWDMENKTDAYSNYEFASSNSGNLLYMGGACSLQTAGMRGSFVIAFAEDFANADAVLADFNALPVA